MELDGKKISFGFSKSQKKPNVILKPKQVEKKVELIDCLEGHSIRIKDKVEEVHTPLVIPIKDNQKNLLDRVRDAKSKQPKANLQEIEDTRPDSELTVDELAARELIREAKNHAANNQPEKTALILLQNDEKPTFEGEKEATLEDYEAVPINDYGLAMLRGMGWQEGMGIGKNNKTVSAVNAPELRPKGLGLGATKIIKAEEEKAKNGSDKNTEELPLVKGAFAKIIAGGKKGNYCEVLGFDEEAGRVIVKTSLNDEILNLNEFMLVPVTKEEFSKGAKVLNNAKYEEYKKISDLKLEKNSHNSYDDRKNGKYEDIKIKKEENRSRSNSRSRENDYNHKEVDRKLKKERKSRSRDRSPSTSKKYSDKSVSYKKYSSEEENSSDNESHKKRRSRKDKSKYRDRSRTPENKNKKTPKKKQHYKNVKNDSDSSSDSSGNSEYERRSRNKSKKKQKHSKSKSKNRDRSRSLSASDEGRSRKKREDSEKKKKKNKCKSRHHRRSSSSSGDETRYKSKSRR